MPLSFSSFRLFLVWMRREKTKRCTNCRTVNGVRCSKARGTEEVFLALLCGPPTRDTGVIRKQNSISEHALPSMTSLAKLQHFFGTGVLFYIIFLLLQNTRQRQKPLGKIQPDAIPDVPVGKQTKPIGINRERVIFRLHVPRLTPSILLSLLRFYQGQVVRPISTQFHQTLEDPRKVLILELPFTSSRTKRSRPT